MIGDGLALELGRKDYDGLQKDEDFVTVKYRIMTDGSTSGESGEHSRCGLKRVSKVNDLRDLVEGQVRAGEETP